MIVVEYPDDRDRLINVSVTFFKVNDELEWDSVTPGSICGGGGKFPFTNQMQELKFLYWAQTETAGITIENWPWGFESRAAVSKIRIYHLKEIPALNIRHPGGRLFGLGLEWGDIIGAEFWPDSAQSEMSYPNTRAEWFVTIENYIKYLRFCGQNVANVGTYMYDGRRYPFKSPISDSSLELDYRDLLLRMFSANDLYMLAGIEYTSSRWFERGFSEQEVAAGADTVWSVSREGKLWQPTGGQDQAHVANVFHPRVQKDMLGIVDELVDKYKRYPAFKGIAFHIFPGIYGPSIGMDSYGSYGGGKESGKSPLEWGYEDITIAQFEKPTGIKIPVGSKDPKRFQKRYDWLMANAKEKWIGWRCREVRDFQMEIYRHIKAARKDLLQVNTLVVYPCYAKRALEQYGGDYAAMLREMGQDPTLYRGVKDLYYNRWREHLISHFRAEEANYYGWEYAINQQAIDLHDRQDSRGMTIFFPFMEHSHSAKDIPKPVWKWLRLLEGRHLFHLINWPTPGHKYYQEAYTRAFVDTDPDLVLFCINDSNVFIGHEQEMREFAKAHLNLPQEKLSLLRGNGFDPNLAVKELRNGNDYYFSVVNPGWWEATATVSLQGIGKAPIVDLITGKQMKVGGKGAMSIALPAYRITAFRTQGRAAKVVGAQAKINEKLVTDYFAQRILYFRTLLANPKAKSALSDDEFQACEKAVADTERLVKERRYFEANDAITNWRLNRLAQEKLSKLAEIIPWNVIGPFPNANDGGKLFRSAQGPESELLKGATPNRENRYLGAENQLIRWTKTATGRYRMCYNFLNLDKLFSPNDWVCAYAHNMVFSPSARKIILSAGSDDGLRVWLNGKLVIDHYEARGFQPGQNKAEAELKKGWNQVLIKVEEQVGGWGFSLDFLDEEGQRMADLEYSPNQIAVGPLALEFSGPLPVNIWYKGEKIARLRYAYFSAQDAAGKPLYLNLKGLPVQLEEKQVAGGRQWSWSGTLEQMEGLKYSQTVTATSNSVVVDLEYSVKVPLRTKPGTSLLYFQISALTDGLYQSPYKLIDTGGNIHSGRMEKAVLQDPKDRKHQSFPNAKEITFDTAVGKVTIRVLSTPPEDTAFQVGAGSGYNADERATLDEWVLGMRIIRREWSAGYRGHHRIEFLFGDAD